VSSSENTDRYSQYCQDALDAIDAIASFTTGLTFVDYDNDRKTRSAVERELLVLGEAIRRMPEFEAQFEAPRRIRAFTNKIRHEYDAIDNLVTWDAATGSRMKAVRAALVQFAAQQRAPAEE
jgi:uncharacterized protein with HEPN domain